MTRRIAVARHVRPRRGRRHAHDDDTVGVGRILAQEEDLEFRRRLDPGRGDLPEALLGTLEGLLDDLASKAGCGILVDAVDEHPAVHRHGRDVLRDLGVAAHRALEVQAARLFGHTDHRGDVVPGARRPHDLDGSERTSGSCAMARRRSVLAPTRDFR